MAKKKIGSIAVPYLVTIFIGILIVGGGTFFLLHYLGIIDGDTQLPEPPKSQITTTTYADNHTILLVLDEPEQRCDLTFMLMRSIPKDKKIIFLGIPTNTIALIDGNQESITESYRKGGASSVVNFTEQVFGIKVDRYMKFDSPSLVKVCDILGGVTYPVSAEIAGFNADGKNQYLNAEQIDTLLTYAAYPDGEYERACSASSIIASMVNQANGMRLSDNLDNSFNTIVNMVDTNITAIDYKNHKTAIKNMLERGTSIANFFIMDGEVAYGEFIPSKKFIEDFVSTYYRYDEEKDNDENN